MLGRFVPKRKVKGEIWRVFSAYVLLKSPVRLSHIFSREPEGGMEGRQRGKY
jgi:hypothetical protein